MTRQLEIKNGSNGEGELFEITIMRANADKPRKRTLSPGESEFLHEAHGSTGFVVEVEPKTSIHDAQLNVIARGLYDNANADKLRELPEEMEAAILSLVGRVPRPRPQAEQEEAVVSLSQSMASDTHGGGADYGVPSAVLASDVDEDADTVFDGGNADPLPDAAA